MTLLEPGTRVRREGQLAYGRVALRAVTQGDYDWLYELETDPRVSGGWRLQGRTVSPEEFVRLLWQNILVQYIVTERTNAFRAGLVMCYSADTRNGTASLALVSPPEFQDTGLAIDGMVLLIDHLFRGWPFRKLYFESLAFNFARFDHANDRPIDLTRLWTVEGQLRDVYYHEGRYWDKYIGSISREAWEAHAEEIFEQILERASSTHT